MRSWASSLNFLGLFLHWERGWGGERNNNNPYLCPFPMIVMRIRWGNLYTVLMSFLFFSSHPPIFLSSFSPSLPLCLPSPFLPAFLISSSFSSYSPMQLGWSRIYQGPAPRSWVGIFESLLLLLLNKVRFSRCTASQNVKTSRWGLQQREF